mmetsp:Transcript_10995/g.15296  ORF Transcript_10995/g.15296 Transcript_10995/m.15296 type:complete len:168 (-) Transcript_10995:304-807(-)
MPRTFLPIKPGTLEDWASVDDSSDSLSIEEEHSQQSELDDEMDEVSTAEDSASVPVWLLKCDSCHADLNNCGMLVHLVSDEAVTLYSSSEEGEVEEKGDENKFDTCDCKIRKTCCKACSTEVGYRVTIPCNICMSQQNNGHYWMYTNVKAYLQSDENRIVTWPNGSS